MKKSQKEFKNDQYRKARGGWSRLLELTCTKCDTVFAHYQKDGPGILKRLYLDRLVGLTNTISKKEVVCSGCGQIIGVQTVYEKEHRPAIRLFVGALAKKIVKK